MAVQEIGGITTAESAVDDIHALLSIGTTDVRSMWIEFPSVLIAFGPFAVAMRWCYRQIGRYIDPLHASVTNFLQAKAKSSSTVAAELANLFSNRRQQRYTRLEVFYTVDRFLKNLNLALFCLV